MHGVGYMTNTKAVDDPEVANLTSMADTLGMTVDEVMTFAGISDAATREQLRPLIEARLKLAHGPLGINEGTL